MVREGICKTRLYFWELCAGLWREGGREGGLLFYYLMNISPFGQTARRLLELNLRLTSASFQCLSDSDINKHHHLTVKTDN